MSVDRETLDRLACALVQTADERTAHNDLMQAALKLRETGLAIRRARDRAREIVQRETPGATANETVEALAGLTRRWHLDAMALMSAIEAYMRAIR